MAGAPPDDHSMTGASSSSRKDTNPRALVSAGDGHVPGSSRATTKAISPPSSLPSNMHSLAHSARSVGPMRHSLHAGRFIRSLFMMHHA
jgi:hypothetical protein